MRLLVRACAHLMQSKQDCCMLPRAGHGFVYKVSAPSGKEYIGQTQTSVRERFKQHCAKSSGCVRLAAAIKKYGRRHMKVVTLSEVPIAMLDKAEQEAIAKFDTFRRGYNMTPGGHLSTWTVPEIAERARAGIKRAHADPAISARYRAGWKRGQSNPDARQKQRVAQRKAHQDPDIHARRMAGLERSRKDPVKQKARGDAIAAANKRDPDINRRRSETLKRTLAAKKAARLAHLSKGTILQTQRERAQFTDKGSMAGESTHTSLMRPGSQYAASCEREAGERCVSPSLLRPPRDFVWRG